MSDFGLLPALMAIPLLFAGLVAALPAEKAYRTALGGTLLTLLAGLYAASVFGWRDGGMQLISGDDLRVVDALGVSFSFGADAVSMWLILLTIGLGPICVACSKTAVTESPRTYYAWLLVLQAAMTGVFASRDLMVFYVCFEFTLIPMWVLINLYGSTNRKKAATKFFLYTFTGSIIALAGLVYVAAYHAQTKNEGWTFSIETLAATARTMPPETQAIVLMALLLGFAVKIPLFPFHTWLPLAHTEAPTAGSVILAGVLLKLGTYGVFRFVLPFTPDAMIAHAPLIAALCLVGILYGGLICWVQEDVKKLVAYSSVAHLGFCVLGMASLNDTGVAGSVMYMINHGLSTGALFLLIGMMYERYHTRSMRDVGGLAARMPCWSTFMVFFVMSSVGLPGLNGFVGEFMCLMGAFQASPTWFGPTCTVSGNAVPGATGGELGPVYALIAGAGMIVAALYLLIMVGKVVFGPLREPHGHDSRQGHGQGHGHGDHDVLPVDLSRREITILVPLAVLCVVLGLYPKLMLDTIRGPVRETVAVIERARSTNPPATPADEPGVTSARADGSTKAEAAR